MDTTVVQLAQAAAATVTTLAATDGWAATKIGLKRLFSADPHVPEEALIDKIDTFGPHTAQDFVAELLLRRIQIDPEFRQRMLDFTRDTASPVGGTSPMTFSATAGDGATVVQAGRDARIS